jgi:hypothetical protein
MKEGDLFPIADQYVYDHIYKTRKLMMVRFTGEHRAPKIGEWYISGATPEGYCAHVTNFISKECIGELVEVKKVITYEVIE